MLFLILLLQPFNFVHDVALATFNIQQEDKFLILNIKLDKEDLENILQTGATKTADLTKETKLLQQYVNQHFYLLVNDQKVNFQVELISQNDYFYHIQLSSNNEFEEFIRNVQLKNTCLIETVQGHSNIVNFNINEKSRSFRMHKDRKRIEVQY